MNEFYRSFVDAAKSIADESGLRWDVSHDAIGEVSREHAWNLTLLRGMVPPPIIWMKNLGYDPSALRALNERRAFHGLSSLHQQAMPDNWKDFYLATLVHELLVKKNKPMYATGTVGRCVKILAASAMDVPPWEIDGDIVQSGYNAALKIGSSGKIAANFFMTIRTVVDLGHLANNSPLSRFCIPFSDQNLQKAHKTVTALKRQNSVNATLDNVQRRILERKSAEKLPERKAFWELVRIVFTERPRSVADAVRFSFAKIAIISGLRIGENILLPVSCCRWRDFYDANGNSAGDSGGISRALMLRHFAEKQAADEGPSGVILYENTQYVPTIFEDIVLESLSTIEKLTSPLRANLKRSTETGRLFPEFDFDERRSVWEMYNRMTGSLMLSKVPIPEELISTYRDSLDHRILDKIYEQQAVAAKEFGVHNTVGRYWRTQSNLGLRIENALGESIKHGEVKNGYIRIRDLEDFVRSEKNSKMPDVEPFALADGGKVFPFDLMFLLPVRGLEDEARKNVIDVNRYFSIGRLSSDDIRYSFGATGTTESLFSKYGETDDDRKLMISPHALRHLQNAELFRLGVADTIITKRFNRRSVKQSYEYDHRSLLEELDDIELPAESVELLSPKALDVLRLISARKIDGPIVDEFRRIQSQQGDVTAFEFLNAEADGFHVTPYGFCVNSFTVDPCPKHLECFNGCRHLTISDVPEERKNLEKLYDRFKLAVANIKSVPIEKRGIGWKNQIKHAETRLANIELMLNTSVGAKPFPDGPDLFENSLEWTNQTIIDDGQERNT